MIKLNGERVDFKQFNDGTLRLKLSPRPSLGELVWLYDGDEEMAQLYFLVHHLRENFKIEEINLLCPYLPNARQDRIQTPDDCFTLRHFCHFINDLNFNKVDIFDPHSHVSEALLNNVKVISPRNLIQGVIVNYLMLLMCLVVKLEIMKHKKLNHCKYLETRILLLDMIF